MKLKKIAALAVAITMVLTPMVFTSCVDPSTDDPDNIEKLTQLPSSFGGEQRNLKGQKFNVLTREDRAANQAFNCVDLVAEDNLGDSAIIQAVSERNLRLKAVFNFEVSRTTTAKVGEDTRGAIQKQDTSYTAYQVGISHALNLACDGSLVDLNGAASYVDVERNYWDSNIAETLSLAGGVYFALGDICTVDDDGIGSFCSIRRFLSDSMAVQEHLKYFMT